MKHSIYLIDSTLSALQGFDFNIIQPVRWNVFVLQMDQFCSSFTIDMCSILRQELTWFIFWRTPASRKLWRSAQCMVQWLLQIDHFNNSHICVPCLKVHAGLIRCQSCKYFFDLRLTWVISLTLYCLGPCATARTCNQPSSTSPKHQMLPQVHEDATVTVNWALRRALYSGLVQETVTCHIHVWFADSWVAEL